MRHSYESAPESTPSHLKQTFGTFGFYRYSLATLVMLSHLLPSKWEVLGEYAVFGFFILSGYVVAYILHHTYLPLKNGISRYLLNRALRVYIPFWIASLMTLWVMVSFYPPPLSGPSALFGYPSSLSWPLFSGWLALNLSAMSAVLMLGFILKPTLLPVAWSLGVEIFYWLLMPLFVLRRTARIIFFLFAVLYTVAVIVISFYPVKDILILRYFSPMAGALPFAIGLFCFLRKQKGRDPIPHVAGIASIVSMIALALFCHHFSDPYFTGFYLAVAFNTMIVLYLGRFDQRKIPTIVCKSDILFGNLAYPIFLLNPAVNLTCMHLFPNASEERSLGMLCLCILATNLLALLLYYGVELPVNHIRQHIKKISRQIPVA